jgi:hypothetical protein
MTRWRSSATSWHATGMPSRRDRVDLTYTDERGLSGVLAGMRVELPVDLPVSSGSTRGTFGEDSIHAVWAIASNYNTAEQPASLHGTFGDEDFALATTFMLRSAGTPSLVGATIVGDIAGEPVSVTISPGADSSSTFAAAGSAGRHSVDVVANVARDKSTIAGTVDGRPVQLTAKRSTTEWNAKRIRGQWDGPASVGLLAATCLLYFM